MTRPIRLLISGVTMLCGIVVKTSVFPPEPEGRIPRVADESGLTVGDERVRSPMTESKFVSGASLLSEKAYEAIAEKPANSYQVIVERNVFALKPAPPPSAPAAPAAPAVPPKEDLFLTGLCNLYSGGCALFMVAEPGKPSTYFKLAEGEQNDWLEVLSVDVKNGTVKARLKKPVMRIRNVEADVLISFDAHGVTKQAMAAK
jgi:hypothetical protein